MKKNLIIKQHDLTDCGPACLLSVIIYYGGYIPIEMLRNNSYTDKNGTSAYNLIDCAKKYGLHAYGVKLKDILTIKNKKLPCIAHIHLKNGYDHFVVIYKKEKNHLIIMDPGRGKIKISINEFNSVFSGVLIILRPFTKLQKINKPNHVRKVFINLFLQNKRKTIAMVIISAFLFIISIFMSYFLKLGKFIIDANYGKKYILIFLFIYLFLYILKNLFDYIKNIILISFTKNVSVKLYYDFSKTIFNLPLNFIKSRTSGEILTRFNELSDVNNVLPSLILSIFLDLIMIFISTFFLISISYKLAIILFAFMIIYIFIGYLFKNPTLYKINKNLDTNAEFNSSVVESVNNLRSIKNLHNEDNMRKRMIDKCNAMIQDTCNLDKHYNNSSTIKNTFYDFMIYLISSYGLILIYYHKLNIIDLFTFLMIINYFTEPIRDLTNIFMKYCFIKTSINKINEFSISLEDSSKGIDFTPGDIVIKNLSYAYNGIDYIVKNYSCTIKDKSKTLIQGESGSGKSTLCQLISSQLTNYEGNIMINKQNIKKYNINQLRKNITYIGQKDSLLIDTIENNIKYERNIDIKEFNTICKICEIDKIVNKKFNHFSSIISESSENISGGEKQRITLARGLLNSGKIIILDESLSEVNKDMEERILLRIINYFKDKTIIYVSHKNYKNIFDETIKV